MRLIGGFSNPAVAATLPSSVYGRARLQDADATADLTGQGWSAFMRGRKGNVDAPADLTSLGFSAFEQSLVGAASATALGLLTKWPVKHTSDYASLDAMITALGAGPYVVHVDNAIACAVNTSCGPNIQFVFEPGVTITVNTGVTLTIYAPEHLRAGRQRLFTLAGTGLVAFTRGGRVLPEWWGAVGDGNSTITVAPVGTDNAAALQAALTALAGTLGGVVRICASCYEYATMLSLPANVMLRGAGRGATLRFTGNAGVAITVPASGSQIVLDDLWISTSDHSLADGHQGAIGLRLQGTFSDLLVRHVGLEGFSTAGVDVTGDNNTIVLRDVTATNCGDAGGANTGAGLYSAPSVAANAVVIDGCHFIANNGWAIYHTGNGGGWTIHGGEYSGNMGGIHLGCINGLNLSGAWFESTTATKHQLEIDQSAGAYSTGVRIGGCWFGGDANADRIILDYCDGIVIEGNHFQTTSGYFVKAASVSRLLHHRISHNYGSAGHVFGDGTENSDAEVIEPAGQTARAGNGTGAITTGGVLYRSVSAVGTLADLNETILKTIPLSAYTLASDGAMLRITAWGTCAANANTKTIKVRLNGLGSSTLAACTGAYNGLGWRIEATIIRLGAASEDGIAVSTVGATIAATDMTTGHVGDLTTDLTPVVTGQNGTASANDIVCRGVLVEYL